MSPQPHGSPRAQGEGEGLPFRASQRLSRANQIAVFTNQVTHSLFGAPHYWDSPFTIGTRVVLLDRGVRLPVLHPQGTHYSLIIHSLFTPYPVSIRSLFTQYSLTFHSLSTQYLLIVHSVLGRLGRRQLPIWTRFTLHSFLASSGLGIYKSIMGRLY